jgi:cyclopropane fatty-acyl-phospholipid synthase-like methyltransferase
MQPALPDWEAYRLMFEGSDLLGPGGEDETRALAKAAGLRPGMRVLELGGGCGRGACQLARELGIEVDSIERDPGRVGEARGRAKHEKVEASVRVHEGDMKRAADLFKPRSFDAIFAEGALYFLGIEDGAKLAKKLVRRGGVLAFTDLCWIEPPERAPAAVRTFWEREAGTVIAPVEAKVEALERAGLTGVKHFALPQAAWDRYYAPVRKNLEIMKARGLQSQAIADMDEEIRAFDAGGREVVGYIAFVGRVP